MNSEGWPTTLVLIFVAERSRLLVRVTPQREAQSSTHLIHSSETKLGDTFPQALLRHRNCIVQVHRARGLHTVLLIQNDFRWHAANCGSDGRNRDRGKIGDGAIASEHEARSLLVGRGKLVEPNLTSGYLA